MDEQDGEDTQDTMNLDILFGVTTQHRNRCE